MPFIGNQPALSYTSFAKQDFTTSATTSYTLDNPVTNENEIALFINFVRQEPTTAYTASGTSLTLTSATSATDDMYCVFLGKAVQTVNPPSGSVGSSQVAASIITGQTALGATPADTDELLISDAGTLKRVDYSYLKVSNTPSFFARVGTSTAFSGATDIKIAADTEEWDTDNAYDSSTNYRFTVPAGEDGKYVIIGSAEFNVYVENEYGRIRFHKNGSVVTASEVRLVLDSAFATIMKTIHIFDLAAGDYLEMYIRTLSSGGTYVANKTSFQGYKLIGV